MTQEVHFSDIKNIIIKNLQKCNYDIKIAVAWFTDEKIISVINNLSIEGITVTIIIYDDHINRKDLYEKLYYNKAKILLSKKLMHNKFCVIDNKTIINGSYNWTNNAKINDENIQITHNDQTFSSKFVDEFNKISINCKNIDEYYAYSNTNLKNIEKDFENYLSKWPKYKYPYFIDLKNFSLPKINSKFEISGFIYLIKDNIEEKKFLWYYFLSQSNFIATKILNFRNEEVVFPPKFYDISIKNKDANNVLEFLFLNCTVEEHTTHDNNTEYYLYLINKKGEQITQKKEFKYRISEVKYLFCNSLYCVDDQKKSDSYFIDINLKQTSIEFNIENIISKRNDRKELFAKLFIVSKFINNKKHYGLLDSDNNIVVPLIYDNYLINYTTFTNFENEYIDFIEFPVLEKKHNYPIDLITIPSYDKKRSSGKIYNYTKIDPFIDRVNFRFSIENYKLIKKFIRSSFEIETTYTNCFFLSDENYKYKDFYLKVANFKFDIPTIKNNSQYTYTINLNLTIEEFNQLKTYYNDNYEFKILINRYENARKREQQIKELEINKKNKGGCYIATMVYGNYDHPEVILLRNFRDDFLAKFLLGRFFIKYYYKYSPKYVKYAKNNKTLNHISKIIIYKLVKLLKKTYYKYQPIQI